MRDRVRLGVNIDHVATVRNARGGGHPDPVRAAREAHRVVTDRYRQGVATNTEVLDAQVALVAAALDRTRAVAGTRLAEARLNRALGRTGK